MARALLCATVTGRTTAELRAARDAAVSADLVELRLDGVTDLDVAAALADRRSPALVTCRPGWEGGRFDGAEETRLATLRQALALGAEFVDLEWRAVREQAGSTRDLQPLIAGQPHRVLVSSHDFDGWPADLAGRARAMWALGGRTIKLAAMAGRLTDTLELRRIAAMGEAVVIGMGASGVPTRLLASHYGSRWTYAGDGVAPGQIPLGRMLGEFRFRDVDAATPVFGVVSTAALQSASPAMHNAALAAAGLGAVYVPLATTGFADFLEYAGAMGLAGASVTIPFKRDALAAACRRDALAERVGAANTLRRPHDAAAAPGAWEATNTDVGGFLDPLERTCPGGLAGARAAVLGAGGSARAVAVALVSAGARVTMHARRPEQAHAIAEALGAGVGAWPPPAGSWDLLVNCTPLGSGAARGQSPLAGGPFGGRLVYDLTYGPGESALVREARAAGCAVLDGLPMLVAQAERQFEWWTGVQAPAGVMHEAALARLAGTMGTPVVQGATGQR